MSVKLDCTPRIVNNPPSNLIGQRQEKRDTAIIPNKSRKLPKIDGNESKFYPGQHISDTG